ncbi:MAG: PQQ-binding-like beta-propeller repeat protein [Luteitalea sp.]|nr:PQQ-binding-like beta-propeller repeat protein [Luteitalea sp.]
MGHIISPPWSSIVAYDLNTGTIQWKRPLGEDEQAVEEGGKETGMLRGGERRGIIVTSTGLLFVNGPDGKLRAYDAANGEVLWTYQLPAGTQGIPAMYEAKGLQFLVVPSSAQPSFGSERRGRGRADDAVRGYIAFALPAGVGSEQ